jgi:F0F1-type ATP synthase delta subunit
MEKSRKFSIQLPENEYRFLKQVAAVQNTTMAQLIRTAWFEKANSLSAIEDIEEKLTTLESLINKGAKSDQLGELFKENAKRQKRLYQKLIEIEDALGGKSC